MSAPPLSDAAAREAVRRDLGCCMLVEAGAGSGKTTLITQRMLSLIENGIAPERIAAITFTKKAAAELRERILGALEQNARGSEACRRAMHDHDRMFVGTIHSFCARILREHAIEAGISPGFTEIDAMEEVPLQEKFWRHYLLALQYTGDPLYTRLVDAGIEPDVLSGLFDEVHAHRDVEIVAPEEPAPDPGEVIAGLEELLAACKELSNLKPGGSWRLLERLLVFEREYSAAPTSWHEDGAILARFLGTLPRKPSAPGALPNKTLLGRKNVDKQPVEALIQSYETFLSERAGPWENRRAAHVYPLVVEFLEAAACAFVADRRRRAICTFDDLIFETTRLLRERESFRSSVGMRWTHILIDEFQDTDPAQAEMAIWLASPSAGGSDWKTARPEGGRLFLVGDPKQSIYRFRRADIETYEFVKSRIAECGKVVQLTSNFRSAQAIADLVNAHFNKAFDGLNTSSGPAQIQAAFAPMIPVGDVAQRTPGRVAKYVLGSGNKESKGDLLPRDAEFLATWIAERIRTSEYSPEDFMILTPQREELKHYAAALSRHSIPFAVSGMKYEAHEYVQELITILRAIANPLDAVSVVAALEGITCGASHLELLEYQGEWTIAIPPVETESVVGQALGRLHAWWKASQELTAAVLIDRVVDDIALLPLIASSALGDISAGSLLSILSGLRQLHEDTASIESAIEAILRMQHDEELTRPLYPDQGHAVRLMNLHRAKGLESRVVVLAAPVEPAGRNREPSFIVLRGPDGKMRGWLRAEGGGALVAAPLSWPDISAEDRLRTEAERVRLLYVATTRAKEELIVGQTPRRHDGSDAAREEYAWSELSDLLVGAEELPVVTADAPDEDPEQSNPQNIPTADTFIERLRAFHERQSAALARGYDMESVTTLAGRAVASFDLYDGAALEEIGGMDDIGLASRTPVMPAASGPSSKTSSGSPGDVSQEFSSDASSRASSVTALQIGTAVHAVLDGLLRGRSIDMLADLIDAVSWNIWGDEEIVAQQKPLIGELVRGATSSTLWQSLVKARAAGNVTPELRIAAVDLDRGVPVVLDGVMDVLVSDGGKLRIVDWKTSGDEGQLAELRSAYERQVATYLGIVRRRTGLEGKGELHVLRHG